MALKPKRKSLADKIGALITARPANFDSDEEAEETKAKVVQPYDEDESDNSGDNLGQSLIRRRNVDTLDQLDERYAGKKVSRRDLHSEDDESDEEDTENEISEEDEEDSKNQISEEDVEDEEMNSEEDDANLEAEEEEDDMEDEEDEDKEDLSDNEEEDKEDLSDNVEDDSEGSEGKSENEDEDYGFDIGNPLLRDRRPESKIKTMSETNVRADIDKGNCVRTQLKVWEGLLEMRIKLQKCLVTSNQMPQHDVQKSLRPEKEFMKRTNEAKSKLSGLLDNLLQLQDMLLKQYPETRNLGAKKGKRKADADEEDENMEDSMDEEIPSDTEDENEEKEEEEQGSSSEEEVKNSKEGVPRKKRKLGDYEKILAERHKSYLDYRNSVIQKWNEKTRIASGTVGKGMSQTTLKQIEFALSDKPKLRKRTQLKRSEYVIVGKPEEIQQNEDSGRGQEYDTEVFDDDDFYHQLLRDLIEYKSSDVTDPIQLSKQWIQLQNLRSKMKRKIDTRATKGRRIRYNVHNKLVNFMAPITVNDTWTDNAKNELYNSLFGKIKPVDGGVH